MVVVTGKLVDELRTAPEEVLSFNDILADVSELNRLKVTSHSLAAVPCKILFQSHYRLRPTSRTGS